MTVGSLFSGIGGFDLGFERAGHKVIWQVEKDKFASEVLKARFPHVQRFDDVRNCGRTNLAPVDIICGGFPCQDLSVAGRREGLAGSRSSLWFEFLRVIGELQPRFAAIENVPGLLSSNDRRDFALILGGLTEGIPQIPSRWLWLDSSEAAVTMQPGACWTLNISESPSAAVACSLSQVLETDVAPTYFLSSKAAAGLIRTAEKKKKKIPDALRVPLLSLAQRLTQT